ncbi:hypothetical protein ANCDUO_13476 [Ancylostoma duodenale]|uniref:Serpin domain-containing protein n=1 Tax=Ancylostoma duodenale TaxID=51022 RepID=A0A0C2CIV0_9BILA|nr:hypothetical protein ANCDUO_13476 [Ancylostoma duodenale]
MDCWHHRNGLRHIIRCTQVEKCTVSEEGTEAAAATGVVMLTKCLVIGPDFFADHPFVYGIFRGGEPIFVGQYC